MMDYSRLAAVLVDERHRELERRIRLAARLREERAPRRRTLSLQPLRRAAAAVTALRPATSVGSEPCTAC